MADMFEEMIVSVLDKHAPIKEVKASPTYKHGLQENTKCLLTGFVRSRSRKGVILFYDILVIKFIA